MPELEERNPTPYNPSRLLFTSNGLISNGIVNGTGYYSGIGSTYSSTSSISDENKYIKNYNYVPKEFVFHKLRNEEELYLGVELEIDCGGENEVNARFVYEYMNSQIKRENVYCKHDGSLRDGFEIVTHPCTIEYHKELAYEGLFKELTKRGYRSHDAATCGLHVHINRDYFGIKKLEQDLNISKLLYLFEKYWDKVELIARRKSNGYARRFLLEEDETPLDLYAKSKEADKYGAINLKHKNTVEIRIFKGTLKVDTFYNTLEFVKVMAQMAKEVDIYEIQFITWDKIKSRFSENLNQYIVEREETVKKEDKEKVSEMISNRRMDDSLSSYLSSYCETLRGRLNLTSVELNVENQIASEEDLIQRQIRDIRTRSRRSRNGLEITNLNRQIADLESELRQLRRSTNN